MTQVTRVPVGLQSFLGTQAQGKNPSELGQLITPVLDIGLFLGVQQEQWQRVGGLFSTDTQLFIEVPAGQVWVLRSIGLVNGGGGPSASYDVSVYLENLPNSAAPQENHPLTEVYTYNIGTNASDTTFYRELRDVIAYAGSRIVFDFGNVSGSNFDPIGYVRYLSLEI